MPSPIVRIALIAISLMLAPGLFATETQKEVSVKSLMDNEEAEHSAIEEAHSQIHLYSDEHFRDVPRSSLLGFMRSARAGDFETAAEYLDLRNLPDDVADIPGEELAKQLKIILDQRLWIDVNQLSESPKGHLNDHLPSYRDRIGIINEPDDYYDILYQRVPGRNDQFIWKFSNQTVAQIPAMYARYGYNEFEQWLDQHIPDFRILGVQGWLWLLAIMIAGTVFLALTPFCHLFIRIIRRYRPATADSIRRFVLGPVRFMLVIYISGSFMAGFHLSLEAQALVKTETLHIIVNAWFVVMLVGFLRRYWETRLEVKGKKEYAVLVKPLASVLRIMTLVTAVLIWLNNIGVNITTLVAGLGIGGLAIALAAQKSLENLLGTITIFMTAPIKVGDFCLVQGSRGMVEEIGLWATKIRTLDRSVVFIPNSQVSAGVIENFSLRDKFTFSRVVYFEHDTDEEKISAVMESIREVLTNTKLVDEGIRRVNLETIGEFGFEVQIYAFIKTTDLAEYKQAIADINLQINKVVQDAGVAYAKPIIPGNKA